MKHTYRLTHQLIARFLVISLFLQSCSNFNNIPISVQKQAIEEHAASTKHADVKHIDIVDKGFTAEGNHIVTFYEVNGQLQASVEVNPLDEKDKVYNGVPVSIEKGTDLAILPQLDKKAQQGRILVQFEKGKKPTRIAIHQPGLMGGGNIIIKRKHQVVSEEKKKTDEGQGEKVVQPGEEKEIPVEKKEIDETDLVFSLGADEGYQDLDLDKEKELEVESQPVTYDTYETAHTALINKDPKAIVIDLRKVELNENQFKELKQAIDNNPIVGYVYWKEGMSAACEKLKEQIEEKLVHNICNYSHHPNDYVHGLLASHVYSKPKTGDKVDLNTFCDEVNNKLREEEELKLKKIPPDNIHTDWEVVQIEDDSEASGYYSALYVNQATHQAVLAFQGTQFVKIEHEESSIFHKAIDVLTSTDLKEDIRGVLHNKITKQQALTYKATKAAAEYVNKTGFNLSITGHSLGGYLAELALAFYHKNCETTLKYVRSVKAVVFDSPGAGEKLNILFTSNIINPSTKFDMSGLPILTYLSAPNLVNSCNQHPGEVYRVFPQLTWDGWTQKWIINRAGILPFIGSDIQELSKGLLALTGHRLLHIISSFDPTTGKPQLGDYTRMKNWPKLNTNKIREDLKVGDLDDSSCVLYHIWKVIHDRAKIDQRQYWEALRHLNKRFKQRKQEGDIEEFMRNYLGCYEESDLPLHKKDILQAEKLRSVDWYLYNLHQNQDKLKTLQEDNLASKVLKNILCYKVKTEPFPQGSKVVISLKEEASEKGTTVEALRERMQRAIDVLLATDIKPDAMEFSKMMDALLLSKNLESSAIQQLSKLYSNITEAKLKNYFPRKDKQEKLREKLEEKRRVCVVSGHGGTGKTSLAAQYAEEREDQQVVWWMSAETKGKHGNKLLIGYENLAQELDINYHELAKVWQENPHKHYQELSREVYKALVNREQSVLLILDNADDPALIADCLLNKPSSVQVIITTRHGGGFKNYPYYNYGEPVELRAFTREEGEEYIQQSLESSLCQPSNQDIQALIDEVTLIPQPLALAVAYISNSNNAIGCVQEYIDELQELKRKGIREEEEGELVLPEARLGIKRLNALSQQVMRYGAYLDPDFIPTSLVISLLKIDNRRELKKILAELEGLSLITIIKGEDNQLGIQIHREVQKACKQKKYVEDWKEGANMPDEALLLNMLQVLHQHMPAVSEVPDQRWQQGKLYASSVVHFLAGAEKELRMQPMLADLLDRMGKYSSEMQFNYRQSLIYYNKSLAMREKLYTGNHPDIARSLNNVGNVYLALRNPKQALGYHKKALEMYEEIPHAKNVYTRRPNHNIACSLNKVGNAYHALGQSEAALKYYWMKIGRAHV